MSTFEKFDIAAFLSRTTVTPPAKVAKAAKPPGLLPYFRNFRNFRRPSTQIVHSGVSDDSSTPQGRRAWSDDLCRRLVAGITYQSPPGLGHWSGAWELVRSPTTRLLALLADWERNGEEGDRRAAIIAAEDVAIAWEQAATRWMGKGRT